MKVSTQFKMFSTVKFISVYSTKDDESSVLYYSSLAVYCIIT